MMYNYGLNHRELCGQCLVLTVIICSFQGGGKGQGNEFGASFQLVLGNQGNELVLLSSWC